MAIKSDGALPHGASYLSTFRHTKSRQWVFSQLFGHVLMPLIAGAIVLLGRIPISGSVLPEILSGLSILTGFLFTLLVFIFQLRLQAGDHENYSSRRMLLRLIDEMNAQTTWAVGVALAMVFGLLIGISVRTDDRIQGFLGAVMVVIVVHLFAVMATCALRTKAAYTEMLRSETKAANDSEAAAIASIRLQDL